MSKVQTLAEHLVTFSESVDCLQRGVVHDLSAPELYDDRRASCLWQPPNGRSRSATCGGRSVGSVPYWIPASGYAALLESTICHAKVRRNAIFLPNGSLLTAAGGTERSLTDLLSRVPAEWSSVISR